jgi:5-methylthioadenosine/S-adenosylhomocysteine deaminase
VLFKNITYLNEEYEVITDTYILVEDKHITYVGAERPFDYEGPTYDGRGKLLIPGFVNSHSHTPMTLIRGYGENLALAQWLNDCIFPFEARMQPDDIYYGTLLGIAEMARYGIVSTTDMYYNIPKMTSAFTTAGMKANLSHTIVGTYGGDFTRSPVYIDSKRGFLNYNEAHDLVKIDIAIHAEYTTDEKVVWGAANLAKELKTGLHFHLSETQGEVEECKARHKGLTPVEYFARQGVFDVPANAAHGVWLEEDDYAILKEHDVTIATCPKSNLKLASGLLNYQKLKEHEIRVALGTDSVASNNNLNFPEEMRVFSLLQKYNSKDPTAASPKEVMALASRNGFIAQRRKDSGVIAPGFKADLAVFDISGTNFQPQDEILNHLVYSASGSDNLLTMVDGQIIYNQGEFPTIDLEQVIFEVNAAKKRILGELKGPGN